MVILFFRRECKDLYDNMNRNCTIIPNKVLLTANGTLRFLKELSEYNICKLLNGTLISKIAYILLFILYKWIVPGYLQLPRSLLVVLLKQVIHIYAILDETHLLHFKSYLKATTLIKCDRSIFLLTLYLNSFFLDKKVNKCTHIQNTIEDVEMLINDYATSVTKTETKLGKMVNINYA